jgi:hypothetical protein
MLIYVVEAALYLAAKHDESSFSMPFAEFHRVIQDLPSFSQLLSAANVPVEDLIWENGMYCTLERSIVQTLKWRSLNKPCAIDFIVLLMTIRTRLAIDRESRKQYFSATSFGSLISSLDGVAQSPEEDTGVRSIVEALPEAFILTFLCTSRK